MSTLNFDDSDMKVVSDIKEHFSASEDTSTSTFIELEKHKKVGNFQLAQTLGKQAYELVFQCDSNVEAKSAYSADSDENCGMACEKNCGVIQDSILKIFAVILTLEDNIESALLSRAAKAIITENVEKNHPEIFSSMQKSGAVSLYYLKINSISRNDMAYEIGESYASLCGEKDNPKLISQGSRLFVYFCDKTIALLKNYSFKKIEEEED